MTPSWTEAHLNELPVKDGVRQRGVEMTRLETFCDAAFAFSVTLLVVGGDGIPKSYPELLQALKAVPAFAASFTAIASLWWSHRTWSRRYGLEDGLTTLISLAFLFVMLVYVYPLKMVFSAFAFWASGGYLPTDFVLNDPREMLGIFVVYGLGFACLSGLLALLHWRVLRVEEDLSLNAIERLRTEQGAAHNLMLGSTGVASALWAAFMPPSIGIYAGFLYMTLSFSMPIVATRYGRRIRSLEAAPV